MLPSKGFFSSYSCPFFENSTCERPYCHFQHRKKKTKCSKIDEKITQGRQVNSNEAVSNSLKGISVNLNVKASTKEYTGSSAIYKTTNLIPFYKPTPISELKKRNTSTGMDYILEGINDVVSIKKQRTQIFNSCEGINDSEFIYPTQNMSKIHHSDDKENSINQCIGKHPNESYRNELYTKNVEYISNSWNRDGMRYDYVLPPLLETLNDACMPSDENKINSVKVNNCSSEVQPLKFVSDKSFSKSSITLLQKSSFSTENTSNIADEETHEDMGITNNTYNQRHTILSSYDYPHSSATEKMCLGGGGEYFLDSILKGKKNEKYFCQETDKNSLYIDNDSNSSSFQSGEAIKNENVLKNETALIDAKNKYSIPRETYANIVKHEKSYNFSSPYKFECSLESRNKNLKQSFFEETTVIRDCKSEEENERVDFYGSEKDPLYNDICIHQANPQTSKTDTSAFNDSPIHSHINEQLSCNSEEGKAMVHTASDGPLSVVSNMNNVKIRIAHSDSTVIRKTSLPIQPPKRLLHASPSQVLLERWKTVGLNGSCRKNTKSDIQATTKETVPKMRIAHVPNVAALLAERERIASSLSKPRPSIGSDMNITTIHTENMQKCKPYCLIDSVNNSKIPLIKRQKCLDKALEFYCQIYSYDTAKAKAIDNEREICSTSKTPAAYFNKFAQLLIRLKKEIVAKDQKELSRVGQDDISNTDKTKNESLYNDLLKYLMNDLEDNGIPVPHPIKIGFAKMKKIYGVSSFNKDKSICINCMKDFQVDAEGFSIERRCKFHPGKLFKQKRKYGTEKIWTCCNRDKESSGCIENELHVRDMVDYDNIPGFKQTKEPTVSSREAYQVFAMDCEMCYTTQGSELTRCTVVDTDLNVVYDKLCVPELPIIDYCTKFSGISKGDLDNISTKLSDVQTDLLHLFNSKTILIGHGIGNDLKAVKLLHNTIIDTSEVYGSFRKHKKLSELTKDILKREIQNSGSGHDSCEDAVAAMELMLVKVREDNKATKPRTIISLDETKKKLWSDKN